MLAILAPHVPLAFLVARFAVARARRGDVPDWRVGRVIVPRRRENFPSPARAQVWFEWRRFGRSLPALVGILLPFELALLFPFRETPGIVFEILAGVLLTPPFMATFVAATVSTAMSPFVATRPLTSVSLIAAKLRATIWSTVATWLLVVAAVPIGLRLSGTMPTAIGWMHRLVETVGTPRAIAIALLVLLGLMATTWKQLVQSLFIGMTGREWIVKASVFVALGVLSVAVPLAHWVFGSRIMMAWLWIAFPWIAAVLVCLKLSAAIWIARRLHDRHLISDRAILLGAVSWDVAVLALYALLVWLTPALLFRGYFLALIAMLAVPLARVSAAPLALAWSRHR